MKKKILKRIRGAAKKTHAPQAFDELFMDLYLLSFLVKALASALSLVTGFYFLTKVFGAQADGNVKYALAAAAVTIVESLKYYITPKAFQNILKKNLPYGLPALAVAMPLFLASVFFTLNGARYFFEDNNKDVENATKTKKTAIRETAGYYDQVIATEQAKHARLMDAHQGTARVGWRSVIAQFDKIEQRIDRLREERGKAMQQEKEGQAATGADVEKEALFMKQNTVNIAIASETLLLLAFLFSQFYLFRSFKDQAKEAKTPPKTRRTEVQMPLII